MCYTGLMKYRKFSPESIREAVAKSFNWKQVSEVLGAGKSGSSYDHLKKRAIAEEIDYSHFRQGSKGMEFGTKRPITDYFSNEIGINSHKLRIRLIKEGIKENKCEICNLDEWLGESMPLELDHINSDHNDNSLENLQIICPNCHYQETKKRRS